MRTSTAMLLLLGAAGCRHSPASYSLTTSGTWTTVIPPGGSRPEMRIDHARRGHKAGCDLETGFAALHWDRTAARIVIHFQESPGDAGLFASSIQRGSGSVRIASRFYTDSVKDVEDFRSRLFERSADGCLTAAERANLLRAITERASLPTQIAYFLPFGTLGQAGFVELTPDFRLKVVSPLGPGYQIAYYSVSAEPGGDRIRLTMAALTASDPGLRTAALRGLPETFGYVRILFWTSLSSANHFAALLAAPDRAALDAATRRFQAAPEGSCRIELPAGSACIAVPPDSAVNAEMRVTVNGANAYVGIGGTVAEAIHARSAPAGLEVRRVHRGRAIPVRFDPGRGDILQLVLLPGDAIRFEHR